VFEVYAGDFAFKAFVVSTHYAYSVAFPDWQGFDASLSEKLRRQWRGHEFVAYVRWGVEHPFALFARVSKGF